jgi:hypothetical protein
MRPALLTLLAILLGLAVAPYPPPPASASCAAPYLLDAGHLVLQRGEPIAVEGRAFADGCRDTMSCSATLGCENCEYTDPEPTPYAGVVLRLRQHGRTWTLGTADAGSAAGGELGRVTWTVDLPRDVEPGRAQLVADHAQPVAVRIR